MMPNQLPAQQQSTGTVPNQTVGSKSKKLFKTLFKSALIAILVVVLAVIVGGVYLFAAMGVIKVPVLSKIVYRPVEATREVKAESVDNEKIKKSVKSELSRGREEAQISITEGNLSYILQNNYLDSLRIENPQVALINNGSQMEIFGKIIGLESNLSAIYNIGLDENGKFIARKVVKLKIGNLVVPDYLIGSKYLSEETVRKISGADLIENTLSDEGSDLTINKMTIGEGKITEYVSTGIQKNSQTNNKTSEDKSELDENILEDKIN